MQQNLLSLVFLSFCSFCLAEDVVCKFQIPKVPEGVFQINLETGDGQTSFAGKPGLLFRGPIFQTTDIEVIIPFQKFSKESEFNEWTKMIDIKMKTYGKAERGSLFELGLLYNGNALPASFDALKVTRIQRYYFYDISKPWPRSDGFARYYNAQGERVGQVAFVNFIPLVCL